MPGRTTTAQPARLQGRHGQPDGDRRRRLMDDLVWVGKGDGEPAWAVGGIVHGRPAHPHVRRALGPDRARRAGGDHRADEADRRAAGRRPRGGRPRLRRGPRGRRASRWTPTSGSPTRGRAATERNRILRRGYSYSRGFDDAGLLDQGLLFVCFQRDLEAGFVTVQNRLDGEPLEEYIRPVGGGYFFAPPGVAGADDYLGGSLLG